MKKSNKFIDYIKNPRLAVIAVVWALSLAAIGGSVAVSIRGGLTALTYAVYPVTVIVTAYGIFLAVRTAPTLKQRFAEFAKKYKFTNNLLYNYGFRTHAFSLVSFAINVGFAVFNGVLGIVWHSIWYGSLAAYYFLLSGIRCGAFVGGQKAKKSSGDDENALLKQKYKIFKISGISLFVLEIAMMAAVTQMVLSKKPMQESEIMAITTAAYTFYKLIFAIVNIVKAKKYNDPLVQTFRNIGFADAAVSLCSLQVTLVATFSEAETETSLTVLNAVTGFSVCALTIVMGILMIVQAVIKLRKFKKGSTEHAGE